MLSLFFHAMALFGLHLNNQDAIALDQADKVYDVLPMLIGCVLMLLSVIAFTALPKGKLIPLIAAAVFLCLGYELAL